MHGGTLIWRKTEEEKERAREREREREGGREIDRDLNYPRVLYLLTLFFLSLVVVKVKLPFGEEKQKNNNGNDWTLSFSRACAFSRTNGEIFQTINPRIRSGKATKLPRTVSLFLLLTNLSAKVSLIYWDFNSLFHNEYSMFEFLCWSR